MEATNKKSNVIEDTIKWSIRIALGIILAVAILAALRAAGVDIYMPVVPPVEESTIPADEELGL